MSSHATDLAVCESLLWASEKFQAALVLYPLPFLFSSPLPSLFPSLLLPSPSLSSSYLPISFLFPSFSPIPGAPPTPPKQLGGLVERFKLFRWGLGQSSSRKTTSCIFIEPRRAALVPTVLWIFVYLLLVVIDLSS